MSTLTEQRNVQPSEPGAIGCYSRKRFTLIELLVVVAIIAVLASMLLPALTRARQVAQIKTCGSQLRQVGMSMAMYIDDNSVFPLQRVGGKSYGPLFYAVQGDNAPAFNRFASDYSVADNISRNGSTTVEELGLMNCPLNRRPKRSNGHYGIWTFSYLAGNVIATWYGRSQSTYNLNQAIGSDALWDFYGYRGGGPIKPHRASNPSMYPIFFDNSPAPVPDGDHYPMHPDGDMNVLYYDGSVDNQRADVNWFGDYAGRQSGNYPKWFFPYVRIDPFPY